MKVLGRYPTLLPSLVCAVMLVLAVPSIWPYTYYVALRWVVCILGIYSAITAYRAKMTPLLVVYVVAAVLFNPIKPFTFRKSAWTYIDLCTAMAFAGLIWFLRRNRGQSAVQPPEGATSTKQDPPV
jgi:hypothetical protein